VELKRGPLGRAKVFKIIDVKSSGHAITEATSSIDIKKRHSLGTKQGHVNTKRLTKGGRKKRFSGTVPGGAASQFWRD